MCNPPNGLYVKSGTDYLMQEHTYFWDNVLCKYRLLSDLFSMTDAQYGAYHDDPRYSAMFVDGGASTGTSYNIDINNGTDTTSKGGILSNIQSFLIPSQPQSKSKSALVIILVIAAICTVAYLLYKNFKA